MVNRIILVAGALAIVLAVGLCVHAATKTSEAAMGPLLADDTAIQEKVTGYVENNDMNQDPVAEAPASNASGSQPTGSQPADPQPVTPQADPQPVAPQPVVQDNVKGAVTEETAKKTALAKAGVKERDASYVYVMHEYDDGLSVYNVEFMVGTMEYECEVDANSGAIIEFDAESIYD